MSVGIGLVTGEPWSTAALWAFSALSMLPPARIWASMPPLSSMRRSRPEKLAWSVSVIWRSTTRTGISVAPDSSSARRSANSQVSPCDRQVVILAPGKGERQQALRDQVAPVNARKALGDHCAHAQLLGRQRRVLARRALPIVIAPDDKPPAPLARPVGEVAVQPAKDIVGHRRDIRAERHHLGAVGRQVAGGDVVADHDQHPPAERCRAAVAAAAAPGYWARAG